MRIGIFGYPAASASLIAAAMERVFAAGIAAELWLLGAPGPNSDAGEAWRQAGRLAGLGERLGFTGILAPEVLACEVGRCDILVFDDGDGPSSRKTTLAAMLDSGRPVVAIDGPRTWSTLAQDGSVCLVPRQPAALADALLRLAHDASLRDELGARGRAFYQRHQARSVVAASVAKLLRECSHLSLPSTTA
jgi:glycosyltransferase involved in cell wall biosynthesis